MTAICRHCEKRPARPRSDFCSDRCYMRAYRRWQQGQAANAYPSSARRGRVPMGQLTRDERIREEARAAAAVERADEVLRELRERGLTRDALARALARVEAA